MSAANLETARSFPMHGVEWIHDHYRAALVRDCDLVVFPLAFVGDRAAIYRQPPAPAVIVHDWLWRRHGAGAIVSVLLLKRLNLVRS